MSQSASLSTLPAEVILDNLLTVLPLRDLFALAATSKYFYSLCYDDIFWKRRLIQDFNYPLAINARTSGYRFLYRGMRRPKVYVWGSVDNGRLGLESARLYRLANRSYGGVAYPSELHTFDRKSRIVQLSAGGWSFHALDSDGKLWVWGQLDGEDFGFQGDPFSVRGKKAPVPHQLEVPVKFTSVSSGRNHSIALDSKGSVWNFRSWGRPYQIVSDLLSPASRNTVIQVSAGWGMSASLTGQGEVLVWWPGEDEFRRRYDEETARSEQSPENRVREAKTKAGDPVIKCMDWNMACDPLPLPALPDLPTLPGAPASTGAENLKIIRIACGNDYLVALTNGGHVLKIDLINTGQGERFEALRNLFRRGVRWQYLPLFSEGARVAQLPEFQAEGRPDAVPEDMRVTHVSATFNTFVAYSTGSSSIVLMGEPNTDSNKPPKVLPSLQHRSIISVVLGDYHRAALTSNGELLTWGAFSSGALGLGDPYELEPGKPGGFRDIGERERSRRARIPPPEVPQPAAVRFDHEDKRPVERFCFAVSASGWHVGALVIDVNEEEANSAEDEASEDDAGPSMPGSFDGSRRLERRNNSGSSSGRGMPEDPNMTSARAFPGLRIGFAARGAYRGRGN